MVASLVTVAGIDAPVYVDEHRQPLFTRIPKYVHRGLARQVGRDAAWLLTVIMSHADTGPWAISDAELADEAGMSERQVQYARKKLEERGFIQVERRKKPGTKQNLPNVYSVTLPAMVGQPVEGVVQEMHQGGAGDAPGVVQEMRSRNNPGEESREGITQLRCPVAEGDAAAASDSGKNDERSGDHRRMWAVFAEVLGWAPVEACERAGDVESRGGWNTYIRRLRERGVTAETLPQLIVRFRVERPGHEPTPYQVWRFVVGPQRARRQDAGAITPAQLAALRERFAARETAPDRPESPERVETDTPKGETGAGSGSRPEGRVERVVREPIVFGDRYGDRITRPTETIIRRRRRPAVQYDDGAMVAAAGGGD